MSDDYDEPQSDESGPKQLRERLARAETERQAEADRASKLERDLAFAKAGIPDGPLGEMFAKGYDGEFTPDAVKNAWTAIQPPAPEAPPDAALVAQQQMAADAAGAAVIQPPARQASGYPDLTEQYATANSADEVVRMAQAAGIPTSLDG